MSSTYPGSIDSLNTGLSDGIDSGDDTPGSTAVGTHAAHHNNLADAINKIEGELGVNPSDTFATVKARIDALALSDQSAGTASLRTLGTGAAQAVAGNDSRLSDTRTPTDASVTNAKVATAAAIARSKLDFGSGLVDADIASGASIAQSKVNGLVAALAAAGAAGSQSIAYSATITPDATAGETVVVGTLTGNITVAAPTNAAAGRRLRFIFTQDGTGGRTVTWNAVFKTPSWYPATGKSKVNTIDFVYDGTSWQQLASAGPVTRWFFNVIDYGAIGDGSTDDTSAVAAAMTAGAGRLVFFPAGTYKITAALSPSANTLLLGEGKKVSILSKFFNGVLFPALASDVGWEHICFEGNGATYSGGCFEILTGSAGQHAAHWRGLNFDGPVIYFGATDAGSRSVFIDQEMSQYNGACSNTGAGVVHGVTGVTSTDIFTSSSDHLMTNGTRVRLYSLRGGSGLSLTTIYYVINKTATTFQLSLTSGGSAVDLVTDVTSVKVVPQRHAVRVIDTQQLSATPRAFYFTNNLGNLGFDFGGCDDFFVNGGYVGGCRFMSETRGLLITGTRLAWLDTQTEILGYNWSITGCDIGSGIKMGSACSGSFGPNTQNARNGAVSGVTGTASNDILTKTGHGLTDDTPVLLSALAGGTGLTQGATYYVIDATANTFKLSGSVSGAVVDFTTDVSAATFIPQIPTYVQDTTAFAQYSQVYTPWEAYTPVVTPASGTFTLGNGTLTGKWSRNGSTISFAIELQIGSSTSQSVSGSKLSISLPVAPVTSPNQVCSAMLNVASPNAVHVGVAVIAGGAIYGMLVHGNVGYYTLTNPVTAANGDLIRITGTYSI